jgi:hypothetical protein
VEILSGFSCKGSGSGLVSAFVVERVWSSRMAAERTFEKGRIRDGMFE